MLVRTGLRIGFTGAGGTGKTTSAAAVAQAFGVSTLKSASRQAYEELNLTEAIVAKQNETEKWDLQKKIFMTKINNDDTTFEFVADRTLLDHWAYCLAYCSTFIPNDEYKRMEALVRNHMKATYSHIYYFPWGYWISEGDGVRQDQYAWQSQIDATILGYIIRWNLKVKEVPQTRGPEARNQFIVNDVRSNNG